MHRAERVAKEAAARLRVLGSMLANSEQAARKGDPDLAFAELGLIGVESTLTGVMKEYAERGIGRTLRGQWREAVLGTLGRLKGRRRDPELEAAVRALRMVGDARHPAYYMDAERGEARTKLVEVARNGAEAAMRAAGIFPRRHEHEVREERAVQRAGQGAGMVR